MQENAPSARTARTSAAFVVALVPTALIAGGFVDRAFGRGVLLLAAAAAVVCMVGSVWLVLRDPQARWQAWLLMVGTVCVLGGGAYLWSVRNEPAAIPIGGFLAILLGLLLLTAGALALRPMRTHVG